MISRLRYWALAALAAGLLGGSAAWAQTTRTVQTDPVRYALALEENPDAAGQWRFRVTVSIPREGADYGIPVAAVPSRLMFRAHKGDVTAFDGSILLSRLLPADAGLLYPMPQSGDTPDTDGVQSGDADALAALDDGAVAAGTIPPTPPRPTPCSTPSWRARPRMNGTPPADTASAPSPESQTSRTPGASKPSATPASGRRPPGLTIGPARSTTPPGAAGAPSMTGSPSR